MAHRKGDDQVAIDLGDRMREDDKPAMRSARECCDRLLDFRSIVNVSGSWRDAEPLGGRLCLAPEREMSSRLRMHENGNPINPRRDVPQYLNPLATHLRFEMSEPGNVAARSRQTLDKAASNRVGHHDENDGRIGGKGLQLRQCRVAVTEDDVGRERQQRLRIFTHESQIAAGPAYVDACRRALRPTQALEPVKHGPKPALIGRGLDRAHQHRDPTRTGGLLRARRERPRRRAADERDELAAPHSITSSALASSVAGTSRPSALAVLRLITSSNLVGC